MLALLGDTQMTYGERYSKTNGWQARHIAQDLLNMYGSDRTVSEHDENKIQFAERADSLNIPVWKLAEQENTL
jgi:hypothetical protein